MKKEELIQIRENLGLTRREFADKLFLRYVTVYAYETGIRPVSGRTEALIRHFLSIESSG